MSFKEKLSNLVTSALGDIAPIIAGTVVSFDHELRVATVRTTHRSGNGFDYYELPWPQTPHGIFANAPTTEAPGRPGTNVIIGFRGFDWSYPVLLTAYDPLHYTGTRLRDRRRLTTYTTRTDKAVIGNI